MSIEKDQLEQEEKDLLIRLAQIHKEKSRLERESADNTGEEAGVHSSVTHAVLNLTAGEPGIVSRLLRRPPFMDDEDEKGNW